MRNSFIKSPPFPSLLWLPLPPGSSPNCLSWNPRPSTGWLQTALSTVFFHHAPLWTINSREAGCSFFPPSKHTHTAPQGQTIAPLPSYVFGSFTWNTLAASHSFLNPMWTSRPVALGRSPWRSTTIVTSSSSAPSWHSVLVPLWWQLWVVPVKGLILSGLVFLCSPPFMSNNIVLLSMLPYK